MEAELTNLPEWDIDKTHPQYHDDLVEVLSGITDPELGFSILELGLVRNVSMIDEGLHIVMILTTPYCPYGPTLMESARSQVEKFLEIKTSIEYGKENWEPAMMEDGLLDTDWGLLP